MKLLTHCKSPGKLILSGEHSTVYGKNSVATTIDLYTEVKVYAVESTWIELYLNNLNYEKTWLHDSLKRYSSLVKKIDDFMFSEEILMKIDELRNDLKSESTNISNSCLVFLLLYLSIGDLSERKCIRVEVSSNLPNGAGLGSSSSYIVSLAQALFTAFEVNIEKKDFNRWCYEMDKLFHGKPSGVDNSICIYGGVILFGDGKIIEQINHEDISKLKMVLVNTNVPRNTKKMVERCRQRLNSFPDIGNQLLELLASVSKQVWMALKTKSNFNQLPMLFEMNQHLLNCLDVGHQQIDVIVNISKKYESVAKMTGAGGGGIVMIYLTNDNKEQSLIEELHSNGFKTYQVKLGVSGVHTV